MAIITTANLKTHLGISDSADDTTLGWAVDAANQAVIEHCGRNFDKVATGSASARVYRAHDPHELYIDDVWETSALIVKTDTGDDGTFETTWVLNTDFILEPLNGLRYGQAWPYTEIRAIGGKLFPTWTRRPAVQVTAAWGWTAVPSAVYEAALIKASRLFKRKNSPEGVLGGWAEFGAVRISRNEDPDVVALLSPYVHPSRVSLVR